MDQFGVPFWTGPEHLCGVGHLLSSIELMVLEIRLKDMDLWSHGLSSRITSQIGSKIGPKMVSK